jgi:starch synthase
MGKVSFLKAGLYYSDHLTTVSPSYAWEITTPEGGRGLDGLLAGRAAAGQLSGILNGVDYDLWSPDHDSSLAAPYDRLSAVEGKAANKLALQQDLGLDQRADAPMLGLVSRFSDQKGVDLVIDAAEAMVNVGAQIVLVGTGEPELEQAARHLAASFPQNIATVIGYDETLAHRVQAASDLFLVPSRFEPCGLTQLYALRYGALPLVRRTGGLADTVRDLESPDGLGTGFLFDQPSVPGLLGAFARAVYVYRQPEIWQAAQGRAMDEDFSWDRAAETYKALYETLVGG